MKDYMYHYFYKIENLINGKYYYGIHSTNNLEDSYMGSGSSLNKDYRIYGKENFVKTIIKFFDSRKEASNYESEVVTQSCVLDENSYNMKVGGDYGKTVGTILVKDKNSIFMRVLPNDPRLKNGELTNISADMTPVYDKQEQKYKLIPQNDYVTDKGERYISVSKGTIIVKDLNGVATRVSVTDKRYLDGTFKLYWTGNKHTSETRAKMSETHRKNGDQRGEKNSQYGTCWITDGVNNKKIKKDLLGHYTENGWVLGRSCNK